MPAESARPSDTSGLEQKIGLLERDRDALLSAMSRGTKIRLLLTLTILLFLAIVLYSFYSLVTNFISNENLQKLATDAQSRLQTNQPDYERQLMGLVETAQPLAIAAFQSRLEEDKPRYLDAVQTAQRTLYENLEDRLQENAEKKYKDVIEKSASILSDEFPAAFDDKIRMQMMTNVAGVVQKMIDRYYIQEIDARLVELREIWAEFPVAPAPPDGENVSVESQLVGTLFELMALKIAQEPEDRTQLLGIPLGPPGPRAVPGQSRREDGSLQAPTPNK